MSDKSRFKNQIDFITEIDKLKHIFRQTLTLNKSRAENSVEHSWHIAIMAIILSEYAKTPKIDLLKVVKMVLIHDLVEIDAGDTPCYNKILCKDQHVRETKAANRIYNLLPNDQAEQLILLWKEFETCKTLNSKFANALDRLQPILSNYYTQGKAWKKHNVKKHQVVERISSIKEGSPKIWNFCLELIEDSVRNGILSQ